MILVSTSTEEPLLLIKGENTFSQSNQNINVDFLINTVSELA